MVSAPAPFAVQRWWGDLLTFQGNPDPRDDGVTHINIWSKGRTSLGRALSNFAHTPFTHPTYGTFHSMEGYWYWVATGMSDNTLRLLYGYRAKQHGKTLPRVKHPDFEALICEGLLAKLNANASLKQALIESSLPLHHYFCYWDKITIPDSGIFQVVFLEDCRAFFRGNA